MYTNQIPFGTDSRIRTTRQSLTGYSVTRWLRGSSSWAELRSARGAGYGNRPRRAETRLEPAPPRGSTIPATPLEILAANSDVRFRSRTLKTDPLQFGEFGADLAVLEAIHCPRRSDYILLVIGSALGTKSNELLPATHLRVPGNLTQDKSVYPPGQKCDRGALPELKIKQSKKQTAEKEKEASKTKPADKLANVSSAGAHEQARVFILNSMFLRLGRNDTSGEKKRKKVQRLRGASNQWRCSASDDLKDAMLRMEERGRDKTSEILKIWRESEEGRGKREEGSEEGRVVWSILLITIRLWTDPSMPKYASFPLSANKDALEHGFWLKPLRNVAIGLHHQRAGHEEGHVCDTLAELFLLMASYTLLGLPKMCPHRLGRVIGLREREHGSSLAAGRQETRFCLSNGRSIYIFITRLVSPLLLSHRAFHLPLLQHIPLSPYPSFHFLEYHEVYKTLTDDSTQLVVVHRARRDRRGRGSNAPHAAAEDWALGIEGGRRGSDGAMQTSLHNRWERVCRSFCQASSALTRTPAKHVNKGEPQNTLPRAHVLAYSFLLVIPSRAWDHAVNRLYHHNVCSREAELLGASNHSD
ncbi:hypothetical protein DFH06DRAFT_1120616 [Mycena polygramma]|nr:hypothetical protein DFH06DRAFT_1120616 [Mycena polygramma]